MKIYKMHELNRRSACRTSRAFPIDIEARENDFFHRAVITKEALRLLFRCQLNASDLRPYLEKAFSEVDYMSDEQRLLQIEESEKNILRYFTWEKRTPHEASTAITDLGQGMLVSVTPDFIFENDETIEIVKIRSSKPSMTKKEIAEDLGLYALFCYGKTLVKTGTKKLVKGSYYFLRRKDDSYGQTPHYDTYFTDEKAGNIITLTDIFDGSVTDADRVFAPLVADFLAGLPKEECSDKDCETCDLYDICRYTEPPIAIEKEPVVKHAQDITLTEAQEKAVSYEKGICRINAGAGAGKTMVIALRTAVLLSKGVKPEEIALMTFTNAGAEEMRSRIKLYAEDFGVDADMDKMTICTFNAFGDEILKKEYAKLGFQSPPTVIDSVERSRIITDILNKKKVPGLNYRYFTMNSRYVKGALPMAEKVFQIIKSYRLTASDTKTILEKLGTDKRFVTDQSVKELTIRYWEYDNRLREENLIDFADQEAMLFELLHSDPFYLETFGFKHIIIDEFQDSNLGQMELIKLMHQCPSFESLMVIGDDSQAIFSFRDTTPDYIIKFEEFMGEAIDDIYLLENHRSTPEIIAFANRINEKNVNRVHKDLIATRPHGKPVTVTGFLTPDEEKTYVVEQIQNKIYTGTAPENIAVICSTKYELMDMANRLAKVKVPTVMLNPEPLLENSRVKAAIGYVLWLYDRTDTKDLLTYANVKVSGDILHMPQSDINLLLGSITTDAEPYAELSAEEKKTFLLDRLKALDTKDDEVYQSFLETLNRKEIWQIQQYCKDFLLFGTDIAYRRVHDYPGVVLTTAHSSKGLEWPIVYDMISKYHTENLDSRSKIARTMTEEKRRLFFVSATRARDELYVTGQYVAYGKKGEYTYNKYLIEAYEATGQEFNVTTIETQREMRKQEQKKKAS